MKEKILKRIKELNKGVSFVELERIEGFRGELGYGKQDLNIMFWDSMSKEACDIMRELTDDGYIEMNGCPILIYLADGKGLDLPIAKKLKRYAKWRWLPVTFNFVKDLEV